MSQPDHEKIETTPTKKWVKFEEEENRTSPDSDEKHIKENGKVSNQFKYNYLSLQCSPIACGGSCN